VASETTHHAHHSVHHASGVPKIGETLTCEKRRCGAEFSRSLRDDASILSPLAGKSYREGLARSEGARTPRDRPSSRHQSSYFSPAGIRTPGLEASSWSSSWTGPVAASTCTLTRSTPRKAASGRIHWNPLAAAPRSAETDATAEC